MIEILKNKYTIIRKIGQGGMAEIYLALEPKTKRKVAIKILAPAFRNDIIKRKRFAHEIELMKKVESPYVAKMHDAGMNENICYIVMEYVDGDILRDYISKFTRLTADQTVDFSKQLALGLDSIHQNKIIHRDIKSQNVMVGQSNTVKIIDFGIAIDDETERLTKTDMLIGSPQYVSPELVRQEKPTIHADIYALGVLMYEMLSGHVPFSGKSALETLKKHQNSPIPRVSKAFPNVPQALENIIIKATAKEKEKRYKSMYEFYLDLNTSLDNSRSNESLIDLDDVKKKSFVDLINSKWSLYIIGSLLLSIIAILIVIFAVRGF